MRTRFFRELIKRFYKKIPYTFICQGCKKKVVREVCKRQLTNLKYCGNCTGGKHWQSTHQDYQKKWWRKNKKIYKKAKPFLVKKS